MAPEDPIADGGCVEADGAIASAIDGGGDAASAGGDAGATGGDTGGSSGSDTGGSSNGDDGNSGDDNGNNKNCFVAGTLVSLSTGKLVPIQSIKVGDEVLSRNPVGKSAISAQKNKLIPEKVLKLYIHRRNTMILTFSDHTTLTTTSGHKFWVDGVGFIIAGKLAIGSSIVTRAGPDLRLIRKVYTHKTQTVYNFEVAFTHTYFVGHDSLWVHNDCGNNRNSNQKADRILRTKFPHPTPAQKRIFLQAISDVKMGGGDGRTNPDLPDEELYDILKWCFPE